MDICQILGEKGLEKALEYYNEEELKNIIEKLELEKLLKIPGFGKKKVMQIQKETFEILTGKKYEDVLFGDAWEIYEEILSILVSYPRTERSRNRFNLYMPLRDKELILRRLNYCQKAKNFVEGLSQEEIKKIIQYLDGISDLKIPVFKKFRDRVLVTDDEEVSTKIKSEYYDSIYISSPNETRGIRDDYPLVFYIYGKNSGVYDTLSEISDFSINVEDFSLRDIVPEIFIERFIENAQKIKLILELYKTLFEIKNSRGVATDDGEKLSEYVQKLQMISDKVESFSKGNFPDERLNKLKVGLNLEELVKSIEKDINERFSKIIEEQNIGIAGKDILSMLSDIKHSDPLKAFQSYIPKQLEESYRKIIKESIENLNQKTGLDVSELFPEEVSFPIEANRNELFEIKETIRKEISKREFEIKKEMMDISELWDFLSQRVEECYDIDFFVAMGRFAVEKNLLMPKIADKGLSFRNGKNVLIQNPVFINYKIGTTEDSMSGNENVILLTGANSGGKTTLLKLALTIQILFQMGFLVPAENPYTSIFDEIGFLSKHRGESRGAFETSLKRLVPLAIEEKKRLLFVDELEAITEPGSAARIIATFLNFLRSSNTICVIVTHLGEDIISSIKSIEGKLPEDMRVDGIEAKGLDESLDLIVDRQPVFYKAGKSTPELIVERLSKITEGKEKEIYQKMVDVLRQKP
ncbi:MAG: DNA-binding protein MutS2 [Candidatus Methanofastidiosum methylothiophilum]|uniref:DNA-binding protein MutS2 n=1 Tax=Candidatus Methanofastidiosum methylothiophilum TaxID=1705564 RepID=A0A150IUK6_9EURY|nr:MAG: DNA-binding protein MutS2 [Candidatus Methanofastidiosum methylthiophilus]KYC48642.1 MAG: DNA-binding protein MutS2 [Candidatus Methanofastidiosum methylthiophilus]KYC51153.1 MAG: DNA-binding protein MutS2 [Candidatus Methanofastidiosum methylthiophilus]